MTKVDIKRVLGKLVAGRLGKFELFRSEPPTSVSLEEEQKLRAMIIASGLFDAEFYVEQYPDVTKGGFDPASLPPGMPRP